MTYLDRRIAIPACWLVLAGCTANPWFHIDSDSGGGGSTGAPGSTGEPEPTSGGSPTTGTPPGSESGGGTTESAEAGESSTGVPPVMTSTTIDPSATTEGPGTDTGGEGSSSGAGESSGGGEACGNGILEEGEACDDGMANLPESPCTPECTMATCGDGFVFFDGGEECDDGNDSNEDECTNACEAPVCGDGFTQPGEVCDAGPDNGKPEIDACAPDCQGTILQKLEIRVTGAATQGLLTKDGKVGVAGADQICQNSFQMYPGPWKALISDGESRVGSVLAWKGDGQVDWPLRPFTIYVNVAQDPLKLIGVTGANALLGRPGEEKPDLQNAIGVAPGLVWTGLKADWTSSKIDCNNWTSKTNLDNGSSGESFDKTQYLQKDGVDGSCQATRRLYCVQMPG